MPNQSISDQVKKKKVNAERFRFLGCLHDVSRVFINIVFVRGSQLKLTKKKRKRKEENSLTYRFLNC